MKRQKNFRIQSLRDQYYLITAEGKFNFPLLAYELMRNNKGNFQYLSASKEELCLSTEIGEENLKDLLYNFELLNIKKVEHILDVCFELGKDWTSVESITGLSKEIYIQELLLTKLSVSMTGFYPGFIYLEGLNEKLYVPRKAIPSLSVENGSFAIGGDYAGIYNLESPGGWSIIGRTNSSLWNVEQNPPIPWSIGDLIKIKRISQSEFENENHTLS